MTPRPRGVEPVHGVLVSVNVPADGAAHPVLEPASGRAGAVRVRAAAVPGDAGAEGSPPGG